jgi:hypothetical protein
MAAAAAVWPGPVSLRKTGANALVSDGGKVVSCENGTEAMACVSVGVLPGGTLVARFKREAGDGKVYVGVMNSDPSDDWATGLARLCPVGTTHLHFVSLDDGGVYQHGGSGSTLRDWVAPAIGEEFSVAINSLAGKDNVKISVGGRDARFGGTQTRPHVREDGVPGAVLFVCPTRGNSVRLVSTTYIGGDKWPRAEVRMRAAATAAAAAGGPGPRVACWFGAFTIHTGTRAAQGADSEGESDSDTSECADDTDAAEATPPAGAAAAAAPNPVVAAFLSLVEGMEEAEAVAAAARAHPLGFRTPALLRRMTRPVAARVLELELHVELFMEAIAGGGGGGGGGSSSGSAR